MKGESERRAMIEVRDLVAGYGDRTVLEGVSFDVFCGEVFGIVGGSGCGKTTLMKQLIGLLRPTSGTILVDGEDVLRADEDQLRRLQRKIGVAFQSGALFASLTLGENIALLLEEYTDLPREVIDLVVRIKLSMVGLNGCGNLQISELSGGMKKRAGLARAMALDPRILFFDEPSAGLDPVTSVELDELIVQINKSLGTTIVVVTHELPSIFTIADRVIMLDGKARNIIAEGDPHDLRDHSSKPSVHAFFNRKPEPSHVAGE
jgi:phospholipid/cholesterol/gamma-HCH transport system ATP-binding protein